jgi:hypothetical protein
MSPTAIADTRARVAAQSHRDGAYRTEAGLDGAWLYSFLMAASFRVGQRLGPRRAAGMGRTPAGLCEMVEIFFVRGLPVTPAVAGGTPFLIRDGAVPRPEDRPGASATRGPASHL